MPAAVLPASQRQEESSKVSGGFSIKDLCSYCVVGGAVSALAEGKTPAHLVKERKWENRGDLRM